MLLIIFKAGISGSLVVIMMSQMQGSVDGFTYLLIFGVACIAGMMLAAGLFSIPFLKKNNEGRSVTKFFDHHFIIVMPAVWK